MKKILLLSLLLTALVGCHGEDKPGKNQTGESPQPVNTR